MSEQNTLETLTINNIMQKEPEEVFDYLYKKYGNIHIEGAVKDESDLTRISQIIGWCINVMAYLNNLYLYLDMNTRAIKKSGDKEQYEKCISKKNTVHGYYEIVDKLYKAVSRQATTYIEQQRELQMIGRSDSVQTGK